jgi:hypothetical protein
MTVEKLKEIFKIKANNSFNCEECAYKKYVWCCPEEGDCKVNKDYTKWLEETTVKFCIKNNITMKMFWEN